MSDRLRPYMWDVVKPNPTRELSYRVKSLLPRAMVVLAVGLPVAYGGAAVFNAMPPYTGDFPANNLRVENREGEIYYLKFPGDHQVIPVYNNKDHKKVEGYTRGNSFVLGKGSTSSQI